MKVPTIAQRINEIMERKRKREKEIQKMKEKRELKELRQSESLLNEIKKEKELTKSFPLSINEVISPQQDSVAEKQSLQSKSTTSSFLSENNNKVIEKDNNLTIQNVDQINNMPSTNTSQNISTEEHPQQQELRKQNQSDLFLRPSKCPIVLPTYYVYLFVMLYILL